MIARNASSAFKRRPAFDASRRYIAAREFLLGGSTLMPGDPVDASKTAARRLRQLFDQRLIKLQLGQDDDQKVVARRGILISGKQYQPGDVVPRGAFISEVRLEQMMRQGTVRLVDAGTPRAPRLQRVASHRASSSRRAA